MNGRTTRRIVGIVHPTARGIVLAAALGVAACGSPEVERVRGGDPGADPGNRDEVVEMHRGAEMYAGTPCLTTLPDCEGPRPVSGRTTEGRDR